MAYGILYTSSFKDRARAITFKVDILQDGYASSSSTITYMATNPVSLKYHSEKGKDQYVIGSSLTYSFMCLVADSHKYDAIFEGDEKEFKINYYQDAALIWTGYIQPDNLTRSYTDNVYQITLNASDWLANLKDIEFRSGTTAYSGNATVLQTIKTCLEFTGIELDFYVQLGMYETTYMTSTSDVLKLAYINRSRFTRQKNGKTEYTSVYDVLTELLKPFYCTLKQVGGKYHIINTSELDSYYNTFTWSSLAAGSRTASSNTVDISAYNVLRQSNYSKLKPELRLDFKRNAYDIGGELIADLDDFSGGGPWTINATDGYSESSDLINITDTDPNNNNTYIRVATSSQTAVSAKYIKIVFDITYLVGYEPDPIYFDVRVTKPSSGQVIETVTAGMDANHYESGVKDMFAIDEAGVYTIEINIQSSETQPWSTGNVIIENVRITSFTTTSSEYDQNYIGYIDQNAQVKKEELYFADANTATDQGGIKAYSGGYQQTAAWNRYDETDGETIQELWALNLLKNRQAYKSFLELSAFDDSYNISASSIIQIDSTNFKIIEIETVYIKNIQNLKLEEIFEADPSYDFSSTTLTTIDGTATETDNPIGGDALHSNLDGLGNDDHTQYHNNTRGDARYYTETETDTWRSSTTQTEMTYVHGVTSDIQSQLNGKVSSQWVTSTDDIYYNTGNVTIGATSGDVKLHIQGTATTSKALIKALTGQSGINSDSTLSLWASEPGSSYYAAGIGENVDGSLYEGVINSSRLGAAIDFRNGVTNIYRLSTSGTVSKTAIFDADGNVFINDITLGGRLNIGGDIEATGEITAYAT